MTKVLRLALLGPVEVVQPLQQLVSAKAHALLYYLAVTERAHSRQSLAALLWGEIPEPDARRNLRGVVMKLRQVVEPYLVVNYHDLAFNPESEYWVDVLEFRQLVREQRQGQWDNEKLETAVSLYRGDFLQDFYIRQAPLFEDWVAREQRHLHESVLFAYQTLVTLCIEQGLYDAGIGYARSLLQLDPTREEGHRQLMWLLARSGQRTAALSQYETCRNILLDELSAAPGRETNALYEGIRSGELDHSPGPLYLVGRARPQAPRVAPPAASAALPATASPFVAGPPISQPAQFFGREREIRRIFNLLKRLPLQNAAVVGPRRSGKTSLLHYLKRITNAPATDLRPEQRQSWLPQPDQYRWVFVDFQDPRLGVQEALLQYLLKQLEFPVPQPCDLDHFMDVVAENLQAPTVVLLDEIGVAMARYPELDDAFWESLRSLATNQVNGRLAFVLAAAEAPDQLAQHRGLGSPFFNIFGYTARLGPLTPAEARDLIASSPIPFPADDVEWMVEQSGCWPMLLQILCRERLLALEEGETGAAWRDEAYEQLQPFLNLTTYEH